MILICKSTELQNFPAGKPIKEIEVKHLPWDLTTVTDAEFVAVVSGPVVVVMKDRSIGGYIPHVTNMMYFQELLAQRLR